MARIRSLYPSFWTDEKVGTLSLGGRLLFQGLWTHADDDGRLQDTPRQLKALIFPYDPPSVTSAQKIDSWLDQMVGLGMLIRYTVEGKPLIQVCNFATYQKPNHPTPSKLPPPTEAFPTPTVALPQEFPTPTVALPPVEESRVEESRVEESRVIVEEGRAAPPAAAAKESFDNFFARMETDFAELDVRMELEHCKAWCQEHRKRGPPESKARFINWLKKAREIKEEHGNGRTPGPIRGRDTSPARAPTGDLDSTPVDWGVTSDEMG